MEDISEDPPTSINPFDVLGVEKKATADQIKTAYRKQALKHHPEKAAPDSKDAANAKFQEVAFAYAILSDERRRKRYDTTGNTSESLDLDNDDLKWTDFFREQYASTISLEILDKTKGEYQGSEEERRDLIAAYEKYKGNLDRMYEVVMLSNPLDDEERFCAILDKAIENGEIKPLKGYTEELAGKKARRMANARKEAEEAEEELKEIDDKKSKKQGGAMKKKDKGVDDASLVAMIQQRQKARATNFLDDLEAKYGGSKSGKKRGSEPPDEAFAEVGARLDKKSRGEGEKKLKTKKRKA